MNGRALDYNRDDFGIRRGQNKHKNEPTYYPQKKYSYRLPQHSRHQQQIQRKLIVDSTVAQIFRKVGRAEFDKF